MTRHESIDLDDFTLAFAVEDWLGLDLVERAAKKWRVSIIRAIWQPDDDDDERDPLDPEEVVVGHAEATAISLGDVNEAGVPAWDVFDMISAETAHLYEVYDEQAGWWHDDLRLVGLGDTALFLETLTLEPAYRGHGLGPAVLVAIIDRLGIGCAFAALEPHPIGEPFGGKSVEQATKSLERLWESVGFEPFRNGVWVLDLGTDVFLSRRREILGFVS